MSRKGTDSGDDKGFKSRKQWRWAFATHQPWARKKAHETKGGKGTRYRRLPASKNSGIRRAFRKGRRGK